MAEHRGKFRKIITDAEGKIDAFTDRLKARLKLNDPLQIVAYRTYGNTGKIFFKGRLLEDKGITRSASSDTIFENLVNMYKRFESDEVPGARLEIDIRGKLHEVFTDDEGYFTFEVNSDIPFICEENWESFQISLVHAPVAFTPGISTTAQVLIPPPDAEFGIISDIDDTILQTGATNLIQTARNTFLNNSHSRLPFAGVAEFYRALQAGSKGKSNNPFFYVSSSPWNLYDLLIDFIEINNIPAGPVLLRDYGINNNKLSGKGGHMGHKFKEIEQILNTYSNLRFVLIGDSGQEDPVIYREIAMKFPGRILAVYIRDVQVRKSGLPVIDITHELKNYNVNMLLVDSTLEAAEHAAESGLICKAAINAVSLDKKLDQGELPGKSDPGQAE
jgi:phosphatidate phosphatase APP1